MPAQVDDRVAGGRSAKAAFDGDDPIAVDDERALRQRLARNHVEQTPGMDQCRSVCCVAENQTGREAQ